MESPYAKSEAPKSQLFFTERVDRPNQHEGIGEFRFFAHAISGMGATRVGLRRHQALIPSKCDGFRRQISTDRPARQTDCG
jgi:hypothetical protein